MFYYIYNPSLTATEPCWGGGGSLCMQMVFMWQQSSMVTFERPGLGRLAGLLDYIYIGVTPNTRVRLLVRCAYVEHAFFFFFFFSFFFLFSLPPLLSSPRHLEWDRLSCHEKHCHAEETSVFTRGLLVFACLWKCTVFVVANSSHCDAVSSLACGVGVGTRVVCLPRITY